jgi:hypothetical protein
MKQLKQILIVSIMLVFVLSASGVSFAGNGPKKDKGPKYNKDAKVTFSGSTNRNKRVRNQGDLSSELVIGKIVKVEPNGIVMDGEFFEFRGVKIQDEYMRPVHKKDVYPGVEAHVLLRHGRVEKITLYGYGHPVFIPYEGNEEFFDQMEEDLKKDGVIMPGMGLQR